MSSTTGTRQRASVRTQNTPHTHTHTHTHTRTPRTTYHTPEKFSNSSPLELFDPKGKNQTNKTKQLNWKVEQCGEGIAGLLGYTWECRRGAQTQPCPSGGDAERRSPLPILLAPDGFGPAPPVLYFAWREWLSLPPSLRGCHSTPTSCMTQRYTTSPSTGDMTPSW